MALQKARPATPNTSLDTGDSLYSDLKMYVAFGSDTVGGKDMISGNTYTRLGTTTRNSDHLDVVQNANRNDSSAYLPWSSNYEFGTAFTIAVVVKVDGSESNSRLFCIPYRDDTSWTTPFETLALGRDGATTSIKLDMFGSNLTNYAASSSTGLWTTSGINMLAVVRNGASGTFYNNGSSAGTFASWSGTAEPLDSANAPPTFMSRSSKTMDEGTDGQIYVVAIWNRALSGSEISEFYNDCYRMLRYVTISGQPSGATINSGDSHLMTVTASGSDSLTYQWYTGTSGDTSNPIGGATSSSYNASPTSTTSYWCRVTESVGGKTADSNAATVNVNVPVTITVQPVGATIGPGGSHTLSVTATGTAPITYQWQVLTPPNTWSNIGGATSSTYNTGSITQTTGYRCVVTNVVGSVNSNSATVTYDANARPTITTQPDSFAVLPQQAFTLTVSATAYSGSLTYQWYIGEPGDTSTPITGATSSTLIDFATWTTKTQSLYCRVSDSAGYTDSNAATMEKYWRIANNDGVRFRILVDWDEDGYYAPEARVGDPLNLNPSPASITTLTNRVTSGSTSIVATPHEYGATSRRWSADTGAGYIALGETGAGSVAEIPVSPVWQTVTVSVWLSSSSASWDTYPLALHVKWSDGTTTVIFSSGITIVNADGTVRIDGVASIPGGVTHAAVRLVKFATASAPTYDIHAVQMVHGLHAAGANTGNILNGYNFGETTDAYNNLQQWATDARWNVGFRQFADVADAGKLTVTLNNDDKIFSPNVSTSPLSGLQAGKSVIIEGTRDEGVTWVRMWTGWLIGLYPEPGVYGRRTATLEAGDARYFLEGRRVEIAMQISQTMSQIVDAILAECELPDGTTLTNQGETTDQSTFSYAADNWENGIDAIRALADTMGGDGFAGYVSRDGEFKTVAWRTFGGITVGGGGPSETVYDLDDNWSSCEYRYYETMRNSFEMAAYPRKASSSTTLTLWTLEDDVVFTGNGTETVIARMSDDTSDWTVGIDPATDNYSGLTATPSTTGLAISLDPRGTSVEITITNSSGAARTVTGLNITGRKIKSKDAIYVRVEPSVTGYDIATLGRREHPQLNYKITATRGRAKFLLESRFWLCLDDTNGEFYECEIPMKESLAEFRLDRDLLDVITISDPQVTDTTVYHRIIGQEHNLSGGCSHHTTRYYLKALRSLSALD